MAGDYRATRVAPGELAGFFASRRADRAWAGCNVPAPLKSDVIPLLNRIDPAAERIGAVNFIHPENGGRRSAPTPISTASPKLSTHLLILGEAKIVLIGSGGARAAHLAIFLARPCRPHHPFPRSCQGAAH